MLDEFFAAVRESISRGTFEEDRKAFTEAYEAEFPEKTGQGPRYTISSPIVMVADG
jgi:queuine tRNA-ribosyltransferase accessory subunit